MSPQVMRVRVGTTVTFSNPADNERPHGAVSFWEPEFDITILMPGQSATHVFETRGEFFYNDPPYPQNTGKIVDYSPSVFSADVYPAGAHLCT
jgi:plastocyanin